MAASAGGARSALVASLLLAVVQSPWPSALASSLSVQPDAQANTSCPWRVNFIDGGDAVERCIDELSITFAGTPSTGLAPEAPPDGQMAPPLPGYKALHGGNWYKLHSRPASWHAAREQCEREGAHLLVVDSAEEARVVRALLGLRPHDNATLVHAGFYPSKNNYTMEIEKSLVFG
ncbi:Hemolymph lipopolysaccharide-binding protein [Gryllus bimaculatus]|nr:Hemolymph lipopolysaccharide-binding protein [Gryllus bimaculatus]